MRVHVYVCKGKSEGEKRDDDLIFVYTFCFFNSSFNLFADPSTDQSTINGFAKHFCQKRQIAITESFLLFPIPFS